ncbi:MAG: cupin domain-containing protein [Leptospiraceae bacterium]|nr:cupin domain-containing protein [Leptospiraceae bacterium]MCP5500516.1 cupin domain-containing protein [Leptospiraceae bacterium]
MSRFSAFAFFFLLASQNCKYTEEGDKAIKTIRQPKSFYPENGRGTLSLFRASGFTTKLLRIGEESYPISQSSDTSYYVISGNVRFWQNDNNSLELKEGEIVYVPSGASFQLQTTTSSALLLIHEAR